MYISVKNKEKNPKIIDVLHVVKDKFATHTFHPSEVCFGAVYLLTKTKCSVWVRGLSVSEEMKDN